MVKIRIVEPGGVPVQPNGRLRQLTCILELGGRVTAGESGFSKSCVTDLTIKSAVRIGGDGGRVDLVAENPIGFYLTVALLV